MSTKNVIFGIALFVVCLNYLMFDFIYIKGITAEKSRKVNEKPNFDKPRQVLITYNLVFTHDHCIQKLKGSFCI
jgi:hypothetical protein